MPTLYVLCGPPGSGKSFYTRCHSNNAVVVSRDEIRFSLLKEGEPYFKAEKKVYKEFINKIQKNLNNGFDVYADATHLTQRSRAKLIMNLKLDGVKVCAINFLVPFDVCVERNNSRIGRAQVPYSTLVDMYDCFIPACKENSSEIVQFDEVICIDKDGKVIESGAYDLVY